MEMIRLSPIAAMDGRLGDAAMSTPRSVFTESRLREAERCVLEVASVIENETRRRRHCA